MATTRRTPRNPPAPRKNPLRELVAEKQRAAGIARSRAGTTGTKIPADDLPALINAHVGEQIQKLETRMLKDFKELGERTVEGNAAALNERLGGRIEALEKGSAMQSETLLSLRDSSRIAAQKVSATVNEIERSLAGAVPGFKLPAAPDAPAIHPQFQLESRNAVVRAQTREITGMEGRLGFCPSCTSTNVRRSSRSGLCEEFLRLFFIAPFRCRSCRHKFYRF